MADVFGSLAPSANLFFIPRHDPRGAQAGRSTALANRGASADEQMLWQDLLKRALQYGDLPNYINNPWRAPVVQGGIAARALFGLEPTDQQRLEDAYSQFPARNYGRPLPDRGTP